MNRMICGAFALVLLMPATLSAQPASEVERRNSRATASAANASAQTRTEARAREIVNNLFERLCPGRCELIQINAQMGEASASGLVEPGFEEDPVGAYEGTVERLRVEILLDSALPTGFRQNLPRMLRFRLRELAPTIEVRTEALQFPEPQLEPTPPVVREPPLMPVRPPAPPASEEDVEPVESDAPAAPPEPEASEEVDAGAVWLSAIPWIGGLLLALMLAFLVLILVRRLSRRPDVGTSAAAGAGGMTTAERRRQLLERQVQEMIDASRAVTNRALRRWLTDDASAVAGFVKLFGPGVLSDLRQRDELSAPLRQVSEQLIRQPAPPIDAEALTLLEQAKARLAAAEIEESSTGSWDFLEGLSTRQLERLLEGAAPAERVCLLAELSTSARSGLIASLPEAQRAKLALSAAASEELSTVERRRLLARMRQAAEDIRGQADSAAAGRALAEEVLGSVSAPDQLSFARELRAERPEVAERVLESVLFEAALVHVSNAALADSGAQAKLPILATFLNGTEDRIRVRLLDALPPGPKRAVEAELSLERNHNRSEFFAARESLVSSVLEVLQRDGESPRRANLEALAEGGPGTNWEAAQ